MFALCTREIPWSWIAIIYILPTWSAVRGRNTDINLFPAPGRTHIYIFIHINICSCRCLRLYSPQQMTDSHQDDLYEVYQPPISVILSVLVTFTMSTCYLLLVTFRFYNYSKVYTHIRGNNIGYLLIQILINSIVFSFLFAWMHCVQGCILQRILTLILSQLSLISITKS